jgi:hypothetical protein
MSAACRRLGTLGRLMISPKECRTAAERYRDMSSGESSELASDLAELADLYDELAQSLEAAVNRHPEPSAGIH